MGCDSVGLCYSKLGVAGKKHNKKLTGTPNPLAHVDDGLAKDYQRSSSDLIYEAIMRGGGEPFGAPYEIGVGSLTVRIVGFFRQKSFFAFETLERPRRKNARNKFTRYGASPFLGRYRGKK
jgi:hypothetical protein